MNLNKSHDFFKPEDCTDRIHIIGCGAIGSTVAENLTRLGLTKLSLYDFDIVEDHNIANQMFTQEDVGKMKTEAVAEYLARINPGITEDLKLYNKGYNGQRLSGYVFLCVDNIDLRRQICEANKDNRFIKGVFDYRMRLTDAQHYAADWNQPKHIEDLLGQMAFTHEEAAKETPVSACNLTLSVAPTVRMICALGVSNFMNFIKGAGLRKMILVDAFNYSVDAF